ncbi:hypothetical protein [Haliovirga abyssi]|nr:hypothetical protein [Haliovirga abyssi]
MLVGISLLIFSGCETNIFSTLDKVDANSQEAVSQSKYEAEEGLNSGDYATAIKNADVVIRSYEEQGKNSVNDFSDTETAERNEYIKFQTIKAESYLGQGGVSALDILDKIYQLNSTTPNTAIKRGTSDNNSSTLINIVNGINSSDLKYAMEAFKKGLPSPEILSPEERDNLKSTYQTAGITYGLNTVIIILNALDTNGDSEIDSSDFNASIINNWNVHKDEIITSLNSTINYLAVALDSSDAVEVLDILRKINTQLKKIPNNFTSDDLDKISKILTGKEVY